MLFCRRHSNSSVLTESWNCSGADIGSEARKYKKNQNIKVDNLRLLDFKDVSKFQRRWRLCFAIMITRWKNKAL